MFREGFKKKSREFIYDFFSTSKGLICVVIDTIHDIWNQGKRGTRVLILNIFQRVFGYLRVIWTSESTQKSRIRKQKVRENSLLFFFYLNPSLR